MQNRKLEALMATARAYYDRGDDLQYDQRSMDRVLQLTPRRRKYLPPEAATGQHTLYLDCSSFTFAAFYQTFGQELESDLTWHIIDYVEPRVFYYEPTHRETPDELAALEKEIRALLLPGDLITFQDGANSGHVMLYVDADTYINCSQNGVEGSYDFVNRRNRFRETGAMWIEKVDWLFAPKADGTLRNNLFAGKVSRFAVSRPLERMGEPTPDAVARMTTARDLRCSVETDHPGAWHAAVGEDVTYVLTVKNMGGADKQVFAFFREPAGTRLSDGAERKGVLSVGAEARFSFTVRVEPGGGICIDAPEITVNGLSVYAPRVLLGREGEQKRIETLNRAFLAGLDEGKTAMRAASDAYAQIGIAVEPETGRYPFTHFCLLDSQPGDVLVRRTQTPDADLAVYGMFGGTGVITPQMCTETGVRTTQIGMRDLMPGDILICCDDACGRRSSACYYTGGQLIGCTEFDEATHTLTPAEAEVYLDSLPGRFCYLLLRPLLGVGA